GLRQGGRELLVGLDVVALPELADGGVHLRVADLDGELIGPRIQEQLAEHVGEHELSGLAEEPLALFRVLLAAQDLPHHVFAALAVVEQRRDAVVDPQHDAVEHFGLEGRAEGAEEGEAKQCSAHGIPYKSRRIRTADCARKSRHCNGFWLAGPATSGGGRRAPGAAWRRSRRAPAPAAPPRPAGAR